MLLDFFEDFLPGGFDLLLAHNFGLRFITFEQLLFLNFSEVRILLTGCHIIVLQSAMLQCSLSL